MAHDVTPPHPRPSPAVLTGRFSLTAVTDPLYRPTAHVDEPAEEFADTPISDTELNNVYADAVRHGDMVRPGRTRRGSRPTRRALVPGPLGLQPALALARDWLVSRRLLFLRPCFWALVQAGLKCSGSYSTIITVVR